MKGNIEIRKPLRGRAIVLLLIAMLVGQARAATISVNFDEVAGGGTCVPADSYLARFGISVSGVTEGTTVGVVDSTQVYGGQATVASSLPNLLTQCGPASVALTYRLNFSTPLDSVSFTRPKLLAGPSGITHPQWSAHAFNQQGLEVATVGEGLIASFSDVPPQTFTLLGPGITSVRFDSNAFNFAAFSAVLIDDLTLISPSPLGPLVLYDDFNAGLINPAKWHGPGEIHAGPSAPNAESIRGVSIGQLHLGLTSYGGIGSDSGITGAGRHRLRINNPIAVTAIQANVAVSQAVAEGCATNPTPTRAQARIIGTFFNDGSSPGPGNFIGDVLASIAKVRDSSFGDRIQALVLRCDASTCLFAQVLASHVFTTSWTEGLRRVDTLGLRWDPLNDRFLFAVNPGTPGEEVVALSYSGFSDANPPAGFNFKELRVDNVVANCAAGRRRASMEALFDDVLLNLEAVP